MRPATWDSERLAYCCNECGIPTVDVHGDRIAACPCEVNASHEMQDLNRRADEFNELLERSSLGSPEVKAIRAQCPPDVLERVMARVKELERKS